MFDAAGDYKKLTTLRRALTTSPVLRTSLLCFVVLTALYISPSTYSNTPPAPPQKPSQIFRGSWTASAGPTQIFRGAWSAEISAHSSNTARGSWTLTNDANETILEGTWSAQITAQDWQGRWTARSRNGRSLAGSWNADLPDLGRKSFQDMFERTLSKQVAGSWRSGRDQGHWWLNSTSSK
jgi:hypothetical protein